MIKSFSGFILGLLLLMSPGLVSASSSNPSELVTEKGAQISWTSSEAGLGQIRYAEDLSSLSSAQWQRANWNSASLLEHRAELKKLNKNTFYVYELRSINGSTGSGDIIPGNFTTHKAGVNQIVVNNLKASVHKDRVVITWKSSANGDSQYRIATSQDELLGQDWQVSGFQVNGTLKHSATLRGLKPGIKYFYQVRSTNASVGDSVSSGVSSFVTKSLR